MGPRSKLPEFDVLSTPVYRGKGGWLTPTGKFLLALAAFFIIAAIIWALRTWKPEQQEKD